MRHDTTPWLGIFLFTFCAPLWADYAWIPEWQTLQVRAGFDAYRTTDNYDTNGNLTATRLNAQAVALSDRVFSLEPELGVAKDWSVWTRLAFLDGSVDNVNGGAASLLTGTGFADWRGGIKWRISEAPLWTLETYFKIPTAPSRPGVVGDLVWGEGNFDIGAKIHYGARFENLYLSLSPGVLGRTGEYSPAATLDFALQAFLQRLYLKFFATSVWSFVPQAIAPSTVASQTLSGTGGSYARLAASPLAVAGGGTVGFLFSKAWRLEAGVSHSIWGQRSPSYLNVSVSLLALLDFSAPDLRPKLRPVPFESEATDP